MRVFLVRLIEPKRPTLTAGRTASPIGGLSRSEEDLGESFCYMPACLCAALLRYLSPCCHVSLWPENPASSAFVQYDSALGIPQPFLHGQQKHPSWWTEQSLVLRLPSVKTGLSQVAFGRLLVQDKTWESCPRLGHLSEV